MDALRAAMAEAQTDFTSTVHQTVYPAIAPTRPELTQAGRTVLITGGGTGVGKAIARNFILASAATVVIVGRRKEVLDEALSELQDTAKRAGSPTTVVARVCDVTRAADVDALWGELAAQGTTIDVLVLNAAKFTEPKTLLELGTEEVWSQFEANVKGPLDFAERFAKQGGDAQKFLIYVTTAAIHALHNAIVSQRPAYSLTKAAGTLTVQLIANGVPPSKIQVINFHPGALYGAGWEAMGVARDALDFDDHDLPGAFAVWAASKEAEFLHGRYVWAAWDVEELATGEIRKRLEEDPDYLTVGLLGLRGSKRA